MCGIIGFNWEDNVLLEKILNIITYRGPDSKGKFFDKGISLGHRRLSILDLSNSGNQPMSNENGTIWITFNGEIYNFKELRTILEKKHHKFKSNTDTEVLVHLYEEFGTEMLSQIYGMFAFCIYDSKKKIFFIARDHVGKKPLYYFNKGKKFIFCSEIKGILQYSELIKKVNENAFQSYFTFRANTSNETFFSGIRKLLPGHFLIYNLKTNNLQINKYWDISFDKNSKKSVSFYTKNILNLLSDSVNRRMISDVPFGAYLSGGVDSGTIVSLMNKFIPNQIKTFSVGFESESELKEAKFLAEKIGTHHHELIINEKSIKSLPKIIYHADEPLADPTIIPTYFLSEYAKKYCSVILTGEGSDEIFGGYPQYKFMRLHSYFINPLPKKIKKSSNFILQKTPSFLLNNIFRFASSLGERGIYRATNFINSSDPSTQYLNQISIFNQEEQTELLLKKSNLYKEYSDYFNNSNKRNIVGKCQNIDFKESMVDDLLMKVDKMTMAFSIEARCPFLDKRLVEFASKIPDKYKIKSFQKEKWILRKSVKNLVPKETMNRKKRHFFVPINQWFKEELSNLRNELLSEKYLKKQGFFSLNYVKKINKDFNDSPLYYSRQLWSLMIFQIWYKIYIENEKIKI